MSALVIKKKTLNENFRELLKESGWYLLLAAVGVFMIAPFLWMLSTSLKDSSSVFTYPPEWIPKPVEFVNYIKAWNAAPFGRFFFNSIFVAVCVTFGQVFTSSLAAYAFARVEFPGRDKIFLCYLATMMIPGQVTMIPVFILLKYIGWIDTFKALIIPTMFTAYGTFMLRQFFLTIPKELEEAAVMDGFSRWQIYYKIIMPLSKPALATLSTFVFLGNWNEFMWPLVITSSVEMRTLPLGLVTFQGQYMTDWNLLMAASTMVLLPVLFVYIFNQKFITKGIVMTGLKG
ncbi:MAG: carbohydrate ABC transporter permease [Elusimicrobiota bacterium]